MTSTINFYNIGKPFGGFSNFSKHIIQLNGKSWPTTEHYFQAQKFAGTDHEEQLRLTSTPMKVAQMGRDRSRPLRPDWEVVKDDIMRAALRAKFSQNEDLRETLLATGDALLVEHTSNDSYWATGATAPARICSDIY